MVWTRISCDVSARARSSSALIWLTSASSNSSVSTSHRTRQETAFTTHDTREAKTSRRRTVFALGDHLAHQLERRLPHRRELGVAGDEPAHVQHVAHEGRAQAHARGTLLLLALDVHGRR